MRGLLAPDPSVLRLSGKFPADPVYPPLTPLGTRRLHPPADSRARASALLLVLVCSQQASVTRDPCLPPGRSRPYDMDAAFTSLLQHGCGMGAFPWE
jgi:hypothetical protein